MTRGGSQGKGEGRGPKTASKILVSFGSDTPEVLEELNAVDMRDRAGRIRILATLGALYLRGKLGQVVTSPPSPQSEQGQAPEPPDAAKERARGDLMRRFAPSVKPPQE